MPYGPYTLDAAEEVTDWIGTDDAGAECVFQITGTFVGTVTFETCVKGNEGTAVALFVVPSNTDTAVTTATAPGLFRTRDGRGGGAKCRVRCSAYTSGTITVRQAVAHYR